VGTISSYALTRKQERIFALTIPIIFTIILFFQDGKSRIGITRVGDIEGR
jgi:hypothetical protein